jgi:glycosyltransferase involved in cell wall biosynthesis
MACGLPVVAPSGSGVEEIVTHGENGLLVASEDGAALAEAVGLLLGDETLRNRLGAAARRFVVGEHDSAAAAGRLERFFETVSATAQ